MFDLGIIALTVVLLAATVGMIVGFDRLSRVE